MHYQGGNWSPILAAWNTPRPINPAPRLVRPPLPPTRANTMQRPKMRLVSQPPTLDLWPGYRPPRQYEDKYSRRVRPSMLQKIIKKYNGLGYLYDHVDAFWKVVHAKKVRDTHTQIEGFGLTLDKKVISWLQKLDKDSKISLKH